MPLLNLTRVLTPKGKNAVLSVLAGTTLLGAFEGAGIYPVLAATVDPLTDAITERTLGARGLEAIEDLTLDAGQFTSESGKRYRCSAVISHTLTSSGAAQAVAGVVCGLTNAADDALFYLQFPDPVVMDEAGEKLRYLVEFGFDGQEFYVLPRILNVGE